MKVDLQIWLGAACAVAGLIGGALLVDRATPSPTISGGPAEPVVVPVVKADARSTFQVTLRAQAARTRVMRSATTGIVTAVHLRPGVSIGAGDPVLSVEDRRVVAFEAEAPLYRDLSPGDRGGDVARLSRFLHKLGLTGAERGSFDDSLTAAVEQFNSRYLDAPGARVFSVASVIWIGPSPLWVGAVTARVGDNVAPGSDLATSHVRIGRVTVAEPRDGLPAASHGYRLEVGDSTVGYQPGARVISQPRAVARLAGQLRIGAELIAIARPRRAVPVLRVPPSAVVVDEDGSTCVFAGVHEAPRSVRVVGGELGVAELAPMVGLTKVLANPLQTRGSVTCSS